MILDLNWKSIYLKSKMVIVMLYKYHVAIVKDDMILTDKYYQENEKPDDEEYKKLIQQYDPDEMILNTVGDDELELFIKEPIDLEKLK